MQKAKTVSAYISAAPKKAQPMLRQIRKLITTVAPKAEEKISYGMPYYDWNGRLAYFAAFRDHVSFFVMSSMRSDSKWAKKLAPYQTGKATLQFPFDSKIPLSLLRQLLTHRLRELKVKSGK
ncbi:MAG: DUF1801 domain-containing protein [Candidatus Nomurabacteria bacterium]|nr:MAG: DUF1801 domain-containing protein [Candidatus Nomurabacteria bacterium]